jgi:hypothetical protein
MQYVVVLDIPEDDLNGDESIENACSITREALEGEAGPYITVRPLSEVIAC